MVSTAEVSLSDCVEVLEARYRIVSHELHDYARPFTACDADYNAMLAERAALSAALTQLRALYRGEVAIPHPLVGPIAMSSARLA
jgi:hypothetical protein